MPGTIGIRLTSLIFRDYSRLGQVPIGLPRKNLCGLLVQDFLLAGCHSFTQPLTNFAAHLQIRCSCVRVEILFKDLLADYT